MRTFVPFTKNTVKDKSGFADATGAMENEGLRDTVLLGMVVEDCFE